MNTWIFIALVILGIGLLAGIFDPKNFLFCLPALAIEGISYLLVKLPAWVLAWKVGMVVKIAFLSMPYLIVIGILIAIIPYIIEGYEKCFDTENILILDDEKYQIIGGIIAGIGIISGIVAGAFAWIPNIGYRIAAIILIPLLIAFLCACVKKKVDDYGESKSYSCLRSKSYSSLHGIDFFSGDDYDL